MTTSSHQFAHNEKKRKKASQTELPLKYSVGKHQDLHGGGSESSLRQGESLLKLGLGAGPGSYMGKVNGAFGELWGHNAN